MRDGQVSSDWWQRPDLYYQGDALVFAGQDVNTLAAQHGTPCFFYSSARVIDNITRVRDALHQAGLERRSRVLFAMKANRNRQLLMHMQQSGLVGIDACSPNEVDHAMACGFAARDISFTNTSLSNEDLARLHAIPGLQVNFDSIHAIRKWGELGRGREIGIRVNPGCGIGRSGNEKLQYCGGITTKFGIYREQFADAIAMANKYDLTISKIHFHTGCGYLTAELPVWQQVIEECLWFVDQLDTVKRVNVGGGLGVPHVASDAPLDLARWAGILYEKFSQRDVTVEVEPGDYLVKDAGILCMTVNVVEQKRDTLFVGVNAGFAIAPEPAWYGLPFQPVPASRRPGATQSVTIAGHINEALDIFYRDAELAPLQEDDCLVLINAGAYSTSMASNHCMRGEFKEVLL